MTGINTVKTISGLSLSNDQTPSPLVKGGRLAQWISPRYREWQRWMQLPTLSQYRHQPGASKGEQLCCSHCGSTQLWEYGSHSLADACREHVCLCCGERLWRSEALSVEQSSSLTSDVEATVKP
ncbi:hypothetical protein [Aliagarivorans marinus]|uniref:hypothetical protein n=1 Tax=Aliagarivorans marinus TaxID=561965 RepID=UPI00041DFCB4|nr:hypothetical protein [Aliagarivorans marinus]